MSRNSKLDTANPKLTSHPKIAVVLFQLGGPDSLDSVEPFLHNLFMDPDIIDFPFAFLARRLLARFISHKRAPFVQKNYMLIGGKSPILELTHNQAKALQARLIQQGIDATVFIAMRYWHPMTDEVVRKIQAGGFEEIILLPLYPQFSQATTYSSFNEWNRMAKKYDLTVPIQRVCCYPNHPSFIEAFVENINLALHKFNNIAPENIDLIFSAHGVPVSYIRKGDPYQIQVEESVRCVVERGGWKSPHMLCYQSKVGPMEWLKPSLLETVERLAHEGRTHVLVIPIAFVTDHIETLHEINIEVRKHAMRHGIGQFELLSALNDHPRFIDCLADLVHVQLESGLEPKLCEALWRRQPRRPIPTKCPAMRR